MPTKQNPIEELEDGVASSIGSSRSTTQGSVPWQDSKAPDIPERDPVKQWETHKGAWFGDAAAWERYSGYKLPDTHPDSPRYQGE